MGSRFPLLMLLGIVFLASVSESLTEKPSRRKCVKICESEKDPSRGQTCQLRCKHVSEPGGKEEEEREIPEPHQEGEKKKKEVEKEEREKPRPFPPPHPTEHEREEEQWRGRHRRGDPEERERVRQREREEEEIREREREKKKGEKHWRREKKEKWEEIEEDRGFPNSDSQKQNNPFHFSSNRFRTLFKNQHGHIRVLQRFDQRSSRQLQNLQERNFLAGEKENVISEIPRQVLEVAFPGNVEKLIKKQRESYFVDAQPQQQKEDTGRNGKKVPLSSILDPLY